MTTIVALEGENDVTWGFDSMLTYGNEMGNLDYTKVFANGDLVMGVAGSLGMAQQLRYMEFPEVDTWDIDRWVTNVFIKRINKKLKNPDDSSWRMLVDVNGRVYDLTNDSWVRYRNGMYGIGSGGQNAYHALLGGATLVRSLEIAAQTDRYSGGELFVKTSTQIKEDLIHE